MTIDGRSSVEHTRCNCLNCLKPWPSSISSLDPVFQPVVSTTLTFHQPRLHPHWAICLPSSQTHLFSTEIIGPTTTENYIHVLLVVRTRFHLRLQPSGITEILHIPTPNSVSQATESRSAKRNTDQSTRVAEDERLSRSNVSEDSSTEYVVASRKVMVRALGTSTRTCQNCLDVCGDPTQCL